MVYANPSIVKVLAADSGLVMSALTTNMEARGYGGHVDDDELPPYDKEFIKNQNAKDDDPRQTLEDALNEDWGSMKEDTIEC